jgi:hypothetical protein
MQATVQVTPEGMVIANLDSDDYAADDDDRKLIGLTAEDMLDQCARVAIATWVEIRERVGVEAE